MLSTIKIGCPASSLSAHRVGCVGNRRGDRRVGAPVVAYAEMAEGPRHRALLGIDTAGVGKPRRRQPRRADADWNPVSKAQRFDADHRCAFLQAQTPGNVAIRQFIVAGDEPAVGRAAAGSHDFGESGARPDRVGDAPRLDVGAAAALGAHHAALGERHDGAPHGVAVHAKLSGDFVLSWQPAAARIGAFRDRPFQAIGDAAPQRDAGHACHRRRHRLLSHCALMGVVIASSSKLHARRLPSCLAT